MAYTYNMALRQLGLKTNSIVGTQSTDMESTYATSPLTSANFNSTIYTFLFLKEQILNAQEGLLLAIALTEKHPWREFVGPSSVNNLSSGDRVTTTAANGAQRVGAWGAVRDTSDSKPCTRKSLRQVQDRIDNPNTLWIMPVYWFAQDGDRIRHTRTTVNLDVCTYTRPDAAALSLTSNILLPDILGPAIVDGAVMMCFRDDENLVQAGRSGELYAAWLNAIKAGQTVVEGRAA